MTETPDQLSKADTVRPAESGPWSRTLLLIAGGVFLGLGFLGVVWVFARAFLVLVLSITIADALSPLARRLERHMRRPVAVTVLYLSFFVVGGLLAWALGPSFVEQGRAIADNAPAIIETAEDYIGRWLRVAPDTLTNAVADAGEGLAARVARLPLTIGSALLVAVMVLFLSFYWLLAEPQVNGLIRSLFPPEKQQRVDAVREKVSRSMGGYLRGVFLSGLATAALTWTGLSLIGVKYALPLAVLAIPGEFIPYVGPVLVAIPGVTVALMQSPQTAIYAALVYLAVQQIEGHILTPNIMNRQTDVPQPLVILALFAGGAVGGLLGAIVAVPLAGAFTVLFHEVLAPMIRKWSGASGSGPIARPD